MKLEVGSLAALLKAKGITRHHVAEKVGWDDSRIDQFIGGYRGTTASRAKLLVVLQELCAMPDLEDEDLLRLIAGTHGAPKGGDAKKIQAKDV